MSLRQCSGASAGPCRCLVEHRGPQSNVAHGWGHLLSHTGCGAPKPHGVVHGPCLDPSPAHAGASGAHSQVYKNFVQALDAIDNGINQYVSDQPPLWVDFTGLSSRVAKLNPNWMEPYTDEELDARFKRAMELTGAW